MRRVRLIATLILAHLAAPLFAPTLVSFVFPSEAHAQNNGNGNGGGGGNGNGNGNSNGNGAGNGNASPPPKADKGVANNRPAAQSLAQKIIVAEQELASRTRELARHVALEARALEALKQALLHADAALSIHDEFKVQVKASPHDKALLKLLRNYEDVLLGADDALAHSYRVYLKAAKLVKSSRAAMLRAEGKVEKMKARGN